MVTIHLLQELGHEVTLVNRVDSQSARASKQGSGRMKRVMLTYIFVQDVVEKRQTKHFYFNEKSNKADLMTKCHTFEAHVGGCAMLGLKLSRDDEKIARNSHSDVSSGQMCLDFKVECGESRTLSAANFAVRSEFTLGDNKFVIFDFFQDLADRDVTVYLTHGHPNVFFPLMNNQLARRADKRNPIV